MNERPEYIDIHSHVNFAAYDADRTEVIARAHEQSIWMMNVGTEKTTSSQAISLAGKYEKGVYAVIGLHPTHTLPSHADEAELNGGAEGTETEFEYEWYKTEAKNDKVVAIGECGLDFFRLDPSVSKEKQLAAFEKQIELSLELNLPLMIHCRAAYDEALEILARYKKENSALRGDIHFYAGNVEQAKKFLDLEFTLSFTGVITFARNYDEVIKYVPLDMLMSETDCPYVTPAPYRGKRNEPAYVKEVVHKIAEIRGEDIEKVKKTLVNNAFRVFNFS